MTTLFVQVSPECEDLISNLPRGYTWGVMSEVYDEEGGGTVEVYCEESIGDDVVSALNKNPDVEIWWEED